jgi:hypothetical protein
MITATIEGRRLKLVVETGEDEAPIEPFYVAPVSARVGRDMSRRYLFALEGIVVPDDDGRVETDLVAAFGFDNAARADEELSAAEGMLITQAAYFWQMVGGMDSVRAMLTVNPETGEQGDLDARGGAVAAFRLRVVPLLQQMSLRLELARQTPTDGTPGTDTPVGGGSSESAPSGTPQPEQPASSPTSATSPVPSP